jgi:hypothetical protein
LRKLFGVPARGQRSGFSFTISDDARYQEVWIVKCGPIGVRQRISELAAFIDGPWGFRRDMAGEATRERKLLEESFQALFILRDVRVDFAAGAFEVSIGHEPRAAMPRTGDVYHVQIMFVDDAIEVHVDEI